jgi:hypothetical protein
MHGAAAQCLPRATFELNRSYRPSIGLRNGADADSASLTTLPIVGQKFTQAPMQTVMSLSFRQQRARVPVGARPLLCKRRGPERAAKAGLVLTCSDAIRLAAL